jgi:hypothetical protein
MDADHALLSALRVRATNPETRVDALDKLSAPALYGPAMPEVITATEADLGVSLHPLLRRLYGEVANGGFGPGYGLLSLGSPDGLHGDRSLSSEVRDGGWPAGLLPLWNWGCAIWSCLDANSLDGTIVTHDDIEGPTVTDFTLRSWLRAWVDGVNLWEEIYESDGPEIVTINPFTRKPTVMKAPGRAKGKKN